MTVAFAQEQPPAAPDSSPPAEAPNPAASEPGPEAAAANGEASGPNAVAEDISDIATDPSLLWTKLDLWLDGFVRHLPNIVVAILLFTAVLLIAWAAKRIFRRWAHRRGRDNLGDVLGGFVRWAIILVGLLLALTIVLPTLRPGDLLAGLGVGSVAIGFAFKDILQNWLAGLLILLRQPFHVGDQIVVNGYEGTVQRIETRATDIRTYDGRRVLIPNSDVYTNAVTVNTAYDTRRSEYDVGIGYGDKVPAAKEAILAALVDVPGVERNPAPEVLPWELAASAVVLKIWWWTDSHRADVVHVRADVIQAIKQALDEAGIDMPFETVVQLWHDQTEELDGIRGRQREGWPRPGGKGEPPRPARIAMQERAAEMGDGAGRQQP